MVKIVLLLLCFSSGPALAGVADRIVVVIDRELVMASDVRFEAVLAGLDPTQHPFWHRQHSTPLNRLVDAVVIRRLAGSVSLYVPEPTSVVTRLDVIRTRFGSHESWTAFLTFWGLDELRFVRMLQRRMKVELYLLRNLQSEAETPAAWQIDFEALMGQVRQRSRIRHIPAANESP
jgi:hypothetical protein